MTNRMTKHRKARKKAGFVRLELWTLPKWVEKIKQFAKSLEGK